MATQVDWPLGGGETLQFDVYDRNLGWNEVPGLYIFSHEQSPGSWRAVYVGQAESFQNRLPNHERLHEAVRLGATHIHARVVPEKLLRDQWERRLIKTLQPPLNTQHR